MEKQYTQILTRKFLEDVNKAEETFSPDLTVGQAVRLESMKEQPKEETKEEAKEEPKEEAKEEAKEGAKEETKEEAPAEEK